MFKKILIANRGEIACRIIKTAKRLNIETIAVYSTADQDSLHVSLADHAICIGEPAAAQSYLNIERIIKAAIESGAQAIHPGYGFLSENPFFADACSQAGIVFIGPSVSAMQAMASKQLAKQMLEKTDVPLTPGYHGSEQGDARLFIEAKQIGFPVLLKAAAGGGGKGMRAVHKESDFFSALEGARRESKASFADDTMLIEKLLSNPRHVEMQIMADNHGNVVHLFERDCSIQRRHQKIIEEAPAPNLSQTLRTQLATAAIAVARAIQYQGAGTIEFLVDEEQRFYFMEMNTRLQVEHPVTEMITGLDLVEWQLRIAANEPLPLTQADIPLNGHAIECRIYAEDPHAQFIPSIGELHFIKEPVGPGVRVDSGVEIGSAISKHYDPMIAKLIVWGEDRTIALHRLQRALNQYHIGGVKTNLPFLKAILQNQSFENAQLSTGFLSNETIVMPTINLQTALLMATCFDYLKHTPQGQHTLEADTFAWQMHLKSKWQVRYSVAGDEHELSITAISLNQLSVTFSKNTFFIDAKLTKNVLIINVNNQPFKAYVEAIEDKINIYTEDGTITIERFNWLRRQVQSTQQGQLTAPMPATVVAILKKTGDHIKAGEGLIVLEAMKMEHTIHAPKDGLLSEIFYEIGAQVNEGAQLVALDDIKGT